MRMKQQSDVDSILIIVYSWSNQVQHSTGNSYSTWWFVNIGNTVVYQYKSQSAAPSEILWLVLYYADTVSDTKLSIISV